MSQLSKFSVLSKLSKLSVVSQLSKSSVASQLSSAKDEKRNSFFTEWRSVNVKKKVKEKTFLDARVPLTFLSCFFLGFGLKGGQSPVEHRGNLYIRTSSPKKLFRFHLGALSGVLKPVTGIL